MLTITPKLKDYLVKHHGATAGLADTHYRTIATRATADGSLTIDQLRTLTSDGGDAKSKIKSLIAESLGELNRERDMHTNGSLTAEQAFGGENIDLLPAGARYKSLKSLAVHEKTGKPVCDERGRPCQTSSELELAKSGAWYKFLASRTPASGVALTDHEKSLVHEILERDRFCGVLSNNWVTDIPGARVKALLDDSTSGGAGLVPEWFDLNVITYPLLHSELLPFVDLVPVPRGSNVEGASIGNPSVSWSYSEGTSIGLFDTANLVAALDTAIHPVTAAVEVGRDLMSDSVARVGSVIEQNVGQVMANELDRVIAIGDGTTQPQGIFTASGVTTLNSSGGAGAAPTVDDYEALLFAIGKQYRKSAYRCAYISSDTSYSRLRGIPVGTTDARRVFGMDHESYSTFGYPHRINNDVPNAKVGFGALARYRMYRRQGQEIRWVTEDAELARKNLSLLIVRGRFGGKIVDANAFAKIEDAQV